MNIVIIGAGNVATILAQKFIAASHTIIQVINRNKDKGHALANKVQAIRFDTSIDQLQQDADFYLIAVSDTAIPEVVKSIHIENGILLHTAGAIDVNVLQPASKKYGVLYPLQSLRSSMPYKQNIPFLIEGNEHVVEQTIYKWATTFSNTITIADSEYRLRSHLAAVLVSNFTNYLYILAEQYCTIYNIDFSLLQPLIEETASRLRNTSPLALQTGPAIRHDKLTMQKHQQLLQKHPQLLNIYNIMSEGIQKMNPK